MNGGKGIYVGGTLLSIQELFLTDVEVVGQDSQPRQIGVREDYTEPASLPLELRPQLLDPSCPRVPIPRSAPALGAATPRRRGCAPRARGTAAWTPRFGRGARPPLLPPAYGSCGAAQRPPTLPLGASPHLQPTALIVSAPDNGAELRLDHLRTCYVHIVSSFIVCIEAREPRPKKEGPDECRVSARPGNLPASLSAPPHLMGPNLRARFLSRSFRTLTRPSRDTPLQQR